MSRSPTFQCTFVDNVTTRMTVFCKDGKLDLARGITLARAAYESRAGKSPPAFEAAHFENDEGVVLQTYTAAELNGK
jgi:hypothetical protein